MLLGLSIRDLRGYAELDAVFRPGPQLVWGSNAAGKTSLLEAIVLAAWGRSHRTAADGELVRWGQELARVEARVGEPDAAFGPRDVVEVALVRSATGGARKRIRVNGVARRAASLVGVLRTVMFAPEEMLLVAGSPSLRREALDRLAGQRSAAVPARPRHLRTRAPAAERPAAADPRGAGDARRSSGSGTRRSSSRGPPCGPSGSACSRRSPSRWPPPTRRSRPTRPPRAAWP